MREKVAVPMLWVSIVAMLMFFAAFTSAYIVSRSSTVWLHFDLPQLFFISTGIIILSSVTMNWAFSSVKKDDLKNLKLATLLTLFLGIAFVISQFLGYKALYAQKIVFAIPN